MKRKQDCRRLFFTGILLLAMIVFPGRGITEALASTTVTKDCNVLYITEEQGLIITVKADEDQSGTGWEWVSAEKTLYLSDFHGKRIYADGNLNIHLSGENIITPGKNTVSQDYSNHAILLQNGNLVINADSDTAALEIEQHDIQGECTVISAETVTLNQGNLHMNMIAAAGNKNIFKGIAGVCYVNNAANAEIYLQADNVFGIRDKLYANTTGTIRITTQEKESAEKQYSIFSVTVQSSGDIYAAALNKDGTIAQGRSRWGIAVFTPESSGSSVVESQGAMSMSAQYVRNVRVLDGKDESGKPVTADKVIFYRNPLLQKSSFYYADGDGSETLQYIKVQVNGSDFSDCEVSVIDSQLFDIPEVEVSNRLIGKISISKSFSTRMMGTGNGQAEDYSATGLPDGLTFSSNGISGTYKSVADEGTAFLKVGTKYVQIHYGAVKYANQKIYIGGSYYPYMEPSSGEGWTYTPGNSVKNACIKLDGYAGSPIRVDGNLDLVVKNSNKIRMVSAEEGGSEFIPAIDVSNSYSENGALNISGDGNLEIQSDNLNGSGIVLKTNSYINVSESVSVNINVSSYGEKDFVSGTRRCMNYSGNGDLSIKITAANGTGVAGIHLKNCSGNVYVKMVNPWSESYNEQLKAANSEVWIYENYTGKVAFSAPSGCAVSPVNNLEVLKVSRWPLNFSEYPIRFELQGRFEIPSEIRKYMVVESAEDENGLVEAESIRFRMLENGSWRMYNASNGNEVINLNFSLDNSGLESLDALDAVLEIPDGRVGMPIEELSLMTAGRPHAVQPYFFTVIQGELPKGIEIKNNIIQGIPLEECASGEVRIKTTSGTSSKGTGYITIKYGKMTYPDLELKGTVGINGNSVFGEVLTADVSNLISAPEGELQYKWYRGEECIEGETGSSYTIAKRDIGQKIKVLINNTGNLGEAASEFTEAVRKADNNRTPLLPHISKVTGTSIEVDVEAGQEYAILPDGEKPDGKTAWNTKGAFYGLNPGSDYDVFTRFSETETTYESTSVKIDARTEDSKWTITGKIRSYNPNNTVTIRLMQDGEKAFEEKIESFSGSGQITQDFRIEGVPEGTYDLKVMKDGHLTYTIEGVVVENEDLDLTASSKQEVRLINLLVGDMDGNGSINVNDLNAVWNAKNYNKSAKYPDVDSITDIDGNGSINVNDLNIVWNSANYNKGEKDCTVTFL
ncbi:MAG: hypothetical protein SOW80_03895 [Anaerovoracaceae bacterium]|nr:hypothetical protein [Anaerovoracaceae bacterium]